MAPGAALPATAGHLPGVSVERRQHGGRGEDGGKVMGGLVTAVAVGEGFRSLGAKLHALDDSFICSFNNPYYDQVCPHVAQGQFLSSKNFKSMSQVSTTTGAKSKS